MIIDHSLLGWHVEGQWYLLSLFLTWTNLDTGDMVGVSHLIFFGGVGGGGFYYGVFIAWYHRITGTVNRGTGF
jgi:hypothetical protein